MFRKVVTLIIASSFLAAAIADTLKIRDDAPKSYIVKKGDTLWDISGVFLNEPWLWPKLWRLNPEIKNPHLIYPGDELRLVYDEHGQPMLVKGKPELKWSPKIRVQSKEQQPIAILPLEELLPYIDFDLFLTPEQVELAPYILGSDENYKSTVNNFKLYVKGDLIAGNGYGIYKTLEPIHDPETLELLGYEAKFAGSGIGLVSGDVAARKPSTVSVDKAVLEMRQGDLVLPINKDQLLPSFYALTPPVKGLSAEIIRSVNRASEFGKFEVVIINKGSEQGVKVGNVFNIERPSPKVVETNDGPIYAEHASRFSRNQYQEGMLMPSEVIGELVTFKVYPKVSFAMVMGSQKSIKLSDLAVAP